MVLLNTIILCTSTVENESAAFPIVGKTALAVILYF